MRRIASVGAGVIVLLVLSALAPAGASASGPVWAYCAKTTPKDTGAYVDKSCTSEAPGHEGGYELLDGVGKGKGFKGKAENFEVHGVASPSGEFDLHCQSGKVSGRYLAPNKVAGVSISLSKCATNISPEQASCAFRSRALSGELGWIDEAKGEAGVKLASENEPEVGLIGEETSCVPGVARRWRGSAIGDWGPVEALSKVSTLAYRAQFFFEEANPRYDQSSNPLAFEGEEGIHIMRSEVSDPTNGYEWTTGDGNAGAFEGTFVDKGETLMVR